MELGTRNFVQGLGENLITGTAHLLIGDHRKMEIVRNCWRRVNILHGGFWGWGGEGVTGGLRVRVKVGWRKYVQGLGDY